MATKDIERSEGKATPGPWMDWWTDNPFADLRRQMDDLVENFSHGFGWPAIWRGAKTPAEAPAASRLADVRVEVNEHDKAYEVVAELPGMDDKDVHVEVANGMLVLKGEKTSEREEKDKNCYFSERSYGAFRRAFRIPEEVDENKIAAEFTKGVLTISLPKTAEAQSKTKKIEVKAK